MPDPVDATLATAGRPCDLGTDPSQFLTRIEDWWETHSLLVDSITDLPDVRKLKLLLLWGGKEFRKFAKDAGVQTQAEEGRPADDLQGALAKLKTKCSQHVNLTMAMYQLMHAKQGTKSVTEFAHELDELASRCQLTDVPYTPDRAKKDAFVFGTSDERLRQEALAKDPEYDALLRLATSYEQSRRDSGKIRAAGAEGQDPVRQVVDTGDVEAVVAKMLAHKLPGKYSARPASTPRYKSGSAGEPDRPKCPNCPTHYRPHEPGRCPARGKTCAACQQRHHFAGSPNCRSSGPGHMGPPPGCASGVRKLEGYDYDDEDEHVGRVVEVGHLRSEDSNHVQLKVNGEPVHFFVDSGCSKTLVPARVYKPTMGCLAKSSVRFRPYGTSALLQVRGQIPVTLRSQSGAQVQTTAYVVEGHQVEPLLGDADAKALGILQINHDGRAAETVAGIMSSLRETGIPLVSVKAPGPPISDDELEQVEQLVNRHQKVFKGVGLLKDRAARFHIDTSVPPAAAPYRPVPLAYQDRLSEHLDQLRRTGKIEDVAPDEESPWISNVVITEKKAQGQIRMNVDMRAANKALQPNKRHVVTVQEMRHRLKGATRFSEMDMTHGFHQIKLDEDSRAISTFRTHEGLHRFKVLFFGPSPASDLFHELVSQALHGLPGCVSIHDNILVWGKTPEEHLQNLDKCLNRPEERGLTLRREKCTFGAASVNWFGWEFSASGMSADPKKVAAIKAAGRPSSPDDVKSFLQACQFNARFMFESEKAYAQLTGPLRELTQKGRRFRWTPACEASYQEICRAMTSDAALRPFDPELPTKHVADAAPDGIASSLFQELPNGSWVPVDHASRALTPVEQNYSQFERESLAQAWGINHHRHYLLGIEFETYTDHRPLLAVYNNGRRGNARVERHRLKVQEYTFTMRHLPGSSNPCDYMSRHPRALDDYSASERQDMDLEADDDVCISTIITNDLPDAVDLKTVQRATQEDATSQKLIRCIERGQLNKDEALKPFRDVFMELMYAHGVILRQDRMYIPDVEIGPGLGSLQRLVVDLAHEGHQGVVKCKRLLRGKVWFPQMDKLVEQKIAGCRGCQASTRTVTRDPLRPTPLPERAWQHVDMDFWGPLPSGDYLLVVIDEYSRYPVVEPTQSTGGDTVIPILDKIFSTHGFPDSAKTDGGPPFNSHAFQSYMRWAGCQHKKVSAEDPEANGLAENFMKVLKKSWHTLMVECKNPKQEMYKLLRQYRATPHSSTGRAPAEVLFNRPFKTRLPNLARPTHGSQGLKEKHDASKATQKHYKDLKANVRPHTITVGDKVLLLQTTTKQRPWYDPLPYHVTRVQGTQITVSREDGKTLTRDAQRLKKVLPDNFSTSANLYVTGQTQEIPELDFPFGGTASRRAGHKVVPPRSDAVILPPTPPPPTTEATTAISEGTARSTDEHSADGSATATGPKAPPQQCSRPTRPACGRQPPAYLQDYVL